MNNLLYPLSRPVVCALVLGVVAACAWKCGRPLAEVIGNYREGRQAMAKGQARAAELQVTMDVMHTRLRSKDRIIRELIAGRLSVNDAGRQYAALPAAPPGFLEHVRKSEQGTSDHERLCRHLIDYACDYLEDGRARQALHHRLMQELDNNLQHFPQPIPAVPVE